MTEDVAALKRQLARLEQQLAEHNGTAPPTTRTEAPDKNGPIITRQQVTGLAHCLNAAECPSYAHGEPPQVEVPAVRETLEWTFRARGGDPAGYFANQISDSATTLQFADPAADSTCDKCGGPMALTEQKRIRYRNLSGFDQHELVRLLREGLLQRDTSGDLDGVVVQKAKDPQPIDTTSPEFVAAVEAAAAAKLANGNGNGGHQDTADLEAARTVLEAGGTQAEAAEAAGVSVRTVRRWAAAGKLHAGGES
jgi:hypothetical protein